MRCAGMILLVPLFVMLSWVPWGPKSAKNPAAGDIHQTFKGIGFCDSNKDAVDVDRAKKDATDVARDLAQRKACDYFIQQDPPIVWSGAEEHLRKHMKEEKYL